MFWDNILVHIHAKYRNDQMKTVREPVGFEKKVDGRRTARHRISSADYVGSGAKKGLTF